MGSPSISIRHPVNLASPHVLAHRHEYFKWLREESPLHRGRVSFIKACFVSRYADCITVLKDPRFVRNRTTATGTKQRFIIPLPKSMKIMAKSMIIEDEPEHGRLRSLVQMTFTPRVLQRLEERIEKLTHQLLDSAEKKGSVDLMTAYALPIPVTVISEMVGVSGDDMPRFRKSIRTLSDGFSGWNLLRTLFIEMPRAVRFVRELIARKRAEPRDDILTGLIQAEAEGHKLTENELVSMVFLLIVAGYETTVHLITNGVATLLQHPQQLDRLRAEPACMESAIEEILRYRGPIQGTKPAYAREDVTLHGVTIPRGSVTLPLIGAANRDPAEFPDPDTFDIGRAPNRHLGFGHGIHYCLGAPLARMETRIALDNLFRRNTNLRLAVKWEDLKLQRVPLWHRYDHLPVVLG